MSSRSGTALRRVSELLGIESPDELSAALCTRRLVTREEEVTVQLTPSQALDSRDALAKALYGRIFGWLVLRCNETIAAAADDVHATVGVLDIFGFESFDTNSFEQLCINYANEALQQHFCADVFLAEQAEYELARASDTTLTPLTWHHSLATNLPPRLTTSRHIPPHHLNRYEREGVPWRHIPYTDNAACVAPLRITSRQNQARA